MAKLSTKELQVLTNSIFEKVELKKEQFKLTQEYLDVEQVVKDKIKYIDLYSLVLEYENLLNQINELQEQRRLIGLEINSLRLKSHNNPWNIESLNQILTSKINVELNDLFPTKQKIEDEIILLSLSGSNDIIDSILTKFNL